MTELVEREREVAQLFALVDAAPAGEGRAVLIEGPAGIGKSALLAEARRRAADGGSLVLGARGSELEREFPFGVVRQLFEGVVAGRERAAERRRGARRAGVRLAGGRGRRVLRRAARPVLGRAQPGRRAAAGAGGRRPALVRPAVAALSRLPCAAARGPADPRARHRAHERARDRRGAAGRDRPRPGHGLDPPRAAERRRRARARARAARAGGRGALLRRLPRGDGRQPAAICASC